MNVFQEPWAVQIIQFAACLGLIIDCIWIPLVAWFFWRRWRRRNETINGKHPVRDTE